MVAVPNLSYMPKSGPEKGLIHTFLNASEAAALVESFFRIEEMFLSEHPPLIKKATGIKGKKNMYFGSEYIIIGVRK